MPKIKKKIQMHIAQRKELDVHKTMQKRERNGTTKKTSDFGCVYRQYLRAAEYLF